MAAVFSSGSGSSSLDASPRASCTAVSANTSCRDDSVVFASFGGEMVDVGAMEARPAVTLDENNVSEQGGIVMTERLRKQVENVRRYYDLCRKVKEAFKEDVEITSA